MTVLNLTDLHGNLHCIDLHRDAMTAADLVVVTGDLTHFGGSRDLGRGAQAYRFSCPADLAPLPGKSCRISDQVHQEGVRLLHLPRVVPGT